MVMMVRDDPKLPDDIGEVPKTIWSGYIAVQFPTVKSSLYLMEKLAMWSHTSCVPKQKQQDDNVMHASVVDCLNVRICDTWEGNMTTKREG